MVALQILGMQDQDTTFWKKIWHFFDKRMRFWHNLCFTAQVTLSISWWHLCHLIKARAIDKNLD